MPHTLHLNVQGSLDLRIVIVLVLNTPLLGLSSVGVMVSGLPSLLGVPGDLLLFVASGSMGSVSGVVASFPTGFGLFVSSGTGSVSEVLVSSGNTFFSAFWFSRCVDFLIGSVAAGNEPFLGLLVCLFALFVSIKCWVAILLAEG